MGTIKRQLRMVFDLNKCLGCHSCTIGCKTMWTDRHEGLQYQYWNNVETQPGRGYPKNWEEIGREAGFQSCGETVRTKKLPAMEDYGPAWDYNHGHVLKTEGGDADSFKVEPSPSPDGKNAYSSNWDEDRGEGVMPNNYYFYLPRICNHCSNPACVAACPVNAPYKREEDGIVLIDQKRCQGFRMCVRGCPYKKPYYNPVLKQSQKCVLCYPRVEKRTAGFCFTQCSGRIRFMGYGDQPGANVNKLIDKWKVALRLHPEFGTDPNVCYIPPLSPIRYAPNGKLDDKQRIPVSVLARYFGDSCTQTVAEREKRIEEVLKTLETEREKVRRGGKSELVEILIAMRESDRLQL